MVYDGLRLIEYDLAACLFELLNQSVYTFGLTMETRWWQTLISKTLFRNVDMLQRLCEPKKISFKLIKQFFLVEHFLTNAMGA